MKMKPIELKKHITKGRCAVKNCSNRCKGKMCSTCRTRKSRLKDPERYAFNNLKNRAKQRGLIFTITLEQFRVWCVKVEYIGFKGRSSESYTVDRIHNDLGYHIDNIQVMTKQDNIRKYFSYDWRTKTATVITDTKTKGRDMPFPL